MRTPRSPGLIGLASILGTTFAYMAYTAARFPEAEDVGATAMAFVGLGYFGAWAIGRSVRAPRLYARHLEERAHQLERAREAEVRAALAEQRGQIARELHDVVAHHVSVMTVQASGARRTLERDPDRSRTALAAIEDTGRTALADMRHIVGVLRGPDAHAGPAAGRRSPQPGLADLPELIEQLSGAGLAVSVHTEGERRDLPLGVDLTAYRVVQEALTNTLKHAGGGHADVTLRYSPSELVIQITDDGPGTAGGTVGQRTGHGVLGMRERVAVYGGDPGGGRPGRRRFRGAGPVAAARRAVG